MIKALRKRTRPDNLVNQVRAGGKSTARRVYLATIGGVVFFLALQFVGPILFLDADGLASKERLIVAPDYSARIEKMHVRPGENVIAGQAIATLNSTEVIDRLAELSTRRTALAAREIQIESRMISLTTLKPLAIERAKRARASVNQLNDLLKRQLTTSSRLSEAIREFYEAEREEAQAVAESRTLADELKQTTASRIELEKIITALKHSYNEGTLVSDVDGRVGSRVPSRGTVTKRGDALVDVFHGETHVIAYLPNSRMYGIDAGDRVVVTDGINRRIGRVQRMESVTDALPAEFQSNFRSQERQQVMRVVFDGEAPFPILAKVKVMSRFSPYALGSMLRTAISVADTPIEAAKLVVSELGGKDQWPKLDMTAVGSLKSFGKVEPKSPVKITDEAEDQPFPEAQAPIDGRGVALPAPMQLDALRRVRATQVRHQVKGPVLAGAKAPPPTGRFKGWY
jgi:multidrug resistance efflux pump